MSTMRPEERAAYLALALTPGIGPTRLVALQAAFGSYRAALAAPLALLARTPSLNVAAATAIRTGGGAPDAERVVERVLALGGRVLLPADRGFPELLLTLADPPAVLFASGDLALIERPAVAVVGSRRPTAYGREAARAVAGTASRAGLVVVSGMARGLDAVAHWAGLDGGGGSIGVLGNGLGIVYPAANRRLYERMGREGLLLTEYPPGERPTKGSFQCRNRLIAGLARVTVVVEAAEHSGALITSGQAADQGREVMAVPGPITSPTSAGTNDLIRAGAGPWLDPDDLFHHYPEVPTTVRAALRGGVSPVAGGLRTELKRAYDVLGPEPRSTDEVAELLDLPAGRALALLSELEIEGAALHRSSGFVRAG